MIHSHQKPARFPALPFVFCLLLLRWPEISLPAQTAPQLRIAVESNVSNLNWTAPPHAWMAATKRGEMAGAASGWAVVTERVSTTQYSNRLSVPRNTDNQFFILEKRGAAVPFVTLEAEDHFAVGTIVALSNSPAATDWTPELEASGRAFVRLDHSGDYVEFTNVVAANTIVIRHCIPDAPGGGGLSASLSLYVNGTKRQSLILSSTNNWLYQANGLSASENGQTNVPGNGAAHVFWDETRYFITNGIQAGDTLRLQKDENDTAAFYRLDLIDLELAPPPLLPPPDGTFLNVTNYGANGSDDLDDTTAIINCIIAAKALKRIVWIPPGTYYQNAKITVDSVTVQGAGMWHTSVIQTRDGTRNFSVTGKSPKIKDIFVANNLTTARTSGAYAFTLVTPCSDWFVENVWITHTSVGLWMSGGQNGTVRGCRVRLTYADAINVNKGASGCLVEHNHVRGVGDDGIAILADISSGPPSTNNILRYNTVIANWWGHNCNLSGGNGHVIENNYLADNSHSACFTINLNTAYPHHPLADSIVQRNTILRGGSNFANQRRGAIWILARGGSITNTVIRDNLILDSLFPGVHLVGDREQFITFERNVVEAPGSEAFRINAEVKGAGLFRSNIVRQLKPGFAAYTNLAGADFSGAFSGNSWP